MFSFPEKDDAFKTHSKQLINELQHVHDWCKTTLLTFSFPTQLLFFFLFLFFLGFFCLLVFFFGGFFLIEETHGGNVFLSPHDKINVGECISCQ